MTAAQFASLALCGLAVLFILCWNIYAEYRAVLRRAWLDSQVVRLALQVNAIEWPICCHGHATATANVRLRAKPDVASAALDTLQAGVQVDVWACVSGWWLVQTTTGKTGWSSATYLRPVGELYP